MGNKAPFKTIYGVAVDKIYEGRELSEQLEEGRLSLARMSLSQAKRGQ